MEEEEGGGREGGGKGGGRGGDCVSIVRSRRCSEIQKKHALNIMHVHDHGEDKSVLVAKEDKIANAHNYILICVTDILLAPLQARDDINSLYECHCGQDQASLATYNASKRTVCGREYNIQAAQSHSKTARKSSPT